MRKMLKVMLFERLFPKSDISLTKLQFIWYNDN